MKNDSDKFLRHIVERMQQDDSVDAPADSVKWAKNLFLSRAEQPQRSVVQHLKALLKFDLAPGKAAFGERSASSAAARQMLFEAGEFTVDLRISGSGKGREVRGQIFGPELSGGRVELSAAGITRKTEVGEMGEFVFRSVSIGEYSLTLTFGETAIGIEGLTIK